MRGAGIIIPKMNFYALAAAKPAGVFVWDGPMSMLHVERDQLLTAGELRTMLRIGREKFRELLANGTLPPPLPLGPKSRRWRASEVARHLEQRMLASSH
ncbi:hypothetical protein [Thiocapsa sp. UBA6158]|uniref:hypothetical protein n=1 Tax=Thiocapsa sp. UBA6158 TaxID=1947692 RepID=UPI0025E5F140|nr:hypothetical protein [Thiocapsa sp. UBA6158]